MVREQSADRNARYPVFGLVRNAILARWRTSGAFPFEHRASPKGRVGIKFRAVQDGANSSATFLTVKNKERRLSSPTDVPRYDINESDVHVHNLIGTQCKKTIYTGDQALMDGVTEPTMKDLRRLRYEKIAGTRRRTALQVWGFREENKVTNRAYALCRAWFALHKEVLKTMGPKQDNKKHQLKSDRDVRARTTVTFSNVYNFVPMLTLTTAATIWTSSCYLREYDIGLIKHAHNASNKINRRSSLTNFHLKDNTWDTKFTRTSKFFAYDCRFAENLKD
ncbi:hypothetical protein IW261DRAFT_1416589 [Armillaria novae-zelandiae]|uniref:Uncharacterized protein n=1 Tax=Armillaria novae-zelandiae TaxID=153914 RepID=A0AA39PK40_9AGAR|nr:hypothetical protein IW261DRAFT_1416589 [Armillaria novae-zelandiae]